jgi:hypothetical protein
MNYEDYENKLPFPTKPIKPSLAYANCTPEMARKYADKLEVWEKEVDNFKCQMDAYQAEEQRLMAQFYTDAIEEVGLSKHPKSNVIYSKAWEDGHSGGYSEVFNKLLDLAEFVERLEAK